MRVTPLATAACVAVLVLGALLMLSLAASTARAGGSCGPACAIPQQFKAVHSAPAVVHKAAAVCNPAVEHVVAQPVYAAPQTIVHTQNIWYGVGQGVAQEAVVAKAVQSALAEYRFEAELRGSITGSVVGAAAGGGTVGPEAAAGGDGYAGGDLPLGAALVDGQQVISQACLSCHSGASPKGGLSMDRPLDLDARAAAARRVLDGSMPPAGPLEGSAKTAAAVALLGG